MMVSEIVVTEHLSGCVAWVVSSPMSTPVRTDGRLQSDLPDLWRAQSASPVRPPGEQHVPDWRAKEESPYDAGAAHLWLARQTVYGRRAIHRQRPRENTDRWRHKEHREPVQVQYKARSQICRAEGRHNREL